MHRVDETDLLRDGEHGATAPRSQATRTVRNRIVNVPCSKHGAVAPVPVRMVEAALEATFAAGQLLAYLGYHLQSLASWLKS